MYESPLQEKFIGQMGENEDIRKYKGLTCTFIYRIGIIKIAILLKVNCKVNIISIKIPMTNRSRQKQYWKALGSTEDPELQVLSRKGKSGDGLLYLSYTAKF